MTHMRVIPLAAGECLNISALTQRGAAWRVQTYPAGFALLLHPSRGPVLFDTGYSERVVLSMRRWPGVLYGLLTPVRLDVRETAAAQLARLGFASDEVKEVIVSHLHADHVGGLRDFGAARFHLDAGAYAPLRDLRGVAAIRKAFMPELLPGDFEARIEPLDFRPAPPGLSPFPLAADVFGDGSAYAVKVPGHAAGMIALIVRTTPDAVLDGDGAGLMLLAADAAWSVRGLRQGLEVHPLARVVFDDAQAERRSAEGLREWLFNHPRAGVFVSHDLPEVRHG
ncbi:MBL fold metallo-hydrolase [Deinococcus arenicola]|uniref:MBL fold metallo-hydrolase n=1 Tax=Deinococcus arenicola TaxID=2994950 RepID=A0ABU4DU47_9DEIO|nr:MBL fold metallo-hydrolase [Deinococcus sp. ZS9-10]MDV6375214.1 MBL fold metallo-hydrolase [Deinococcus sp. ZS9-10]